MKKITFVLACFILVSLNCSDDDTNPPANSQFDDIRETFLPAALHLLDETRNDEDNSRNIVISPLSIEIALMMTLNGAEGETFDQMRSTLGLMNFNTGEINASYIELDQILSDSDPAEINIENAVFWDPGRISLFTDFQDTMKIAYDANVEDLDFSDPAAVDAINDWADNSTKGRIQKILESINQDEAMFLINALYMKADWEQPFPMETTENRPFTLRNGNTIQVPTMWQDAGFSHYTGNDLTAVDLAFKDSVMSMTFILPPEDQSISELLNELRTNPESLKDLFQTKLTTQRAIVVLPKFEVTYHKELKDVLSELGMPRAFNENQAQFPNFGEAGGNIFLSRVLHDTYLKIDEKGAEGAAVTTVGVGVTSLPPVLEFNRPFLFLIRHNESDAIIFAGIIENPVQAD